MNNSRLTSRLKAHSVYLTDHDLKSLSHMRSDCQLNGVDASIVLLDWFNPNFEEIPADMPSVRVIAGDVLYKSILITPFMTTVKKLLQRCLQGEMLLCHVPRAGVTHDMVVEAAQTQGIIISPIAREEWLNDDSLSFLHCSQEEIDSATLYHLTLKYSNI